MADPSNSAYTPNMWTLPQQLVSLADSEAQTQSMILDRFVSSFSKRRDNETTFAMRNVAVVDLRADDDVLPRVQLAVGTQLIEDETLAVGDLKMRQ